MHRRNILRVFHFLSTLLFVLSAGYILIWGLLKAGRSWWFIVSVLGYLVSILFLLISLYLFALFKGFGCNPALEIEHPLTSSVYYLIFYDISPFLGAFAGGFGAIEVSMFSHYLLLIAAGSFWATFLVWIIIDIVVGLLETQVPSSRTHRRKRLAETKAVRRQERLSKERLLSEIASRKQQEQQQWENILLPFAEKLASLVCSEDSESRQREMKVVDIGLTAWQIGGLNCMRQVYNLTMEICRKNYGAVNFVEDVSVWWDGIGSWRNNWLEADVELFRRQKSVSCKA